MEPTTSFDLSGRAGLRLEGADAETRRLVETEMDPFRPAQPVNGVPQVRLEQVAPGGLGPYTELQRPAGDGVMTASNGASLTMVKDGRGCTLPDALNDDPARMTFETGFPLASVFGSVVRPALQLAALRAQAVALHAAAVELEDVGGVVIAGWSESGKTETALAFMEEGARFISDKWTVLGADGTLSAFPVSVGVRGWCLRYLPRLRSALRSRARARLALARAAPPAAQQLRRIPSRQTYAAAAVDLLERGLGMAERVPFAPSELSAAYGQTQDPARRIPVRALALLTTSAGSGIRADAADAAWAARRMARSAAFERRPYFALRERAGYARAGAANGGAEEVVERERALLESVLQETTVIRVHAPFPTDPRTVAAAVSHRLV